jgi:hypothetical protein
MNKGLILALRRRAARARLALAEANLDLLRARIAALGPAAPPDDQPSLASCGCPFRDDVCRRGLCRVCGPAGDISIAV